MIFLIKRVEVGEGFPLRETRKKTSEFLILNMDIAHALLNTHIFLGDIIIIIFCLDEKNKPTHDGRTDSHR